MFYVSEELSVLMVQDWDKVFDVAQCYEKFFDPLDHQRIGPLFFYHKRI